MGVLIFPLSRIAEVGPYRLEPENPNPGSVQSTSSQQQILPGLLPYEDEIEMTDEQEEELLRTQTDEEMETEVAVQNLEEVMTGNPFLAMSIEELQANFNQALDEVRQ
jgi:hypothetical protein